jgi:hypothetical protein
VENMEEKWHSFDEKKNWTDPYVPLPSWFYRWSVVKVRQFVRTVATSRSVKDTGMEGVSDLEFVGGQNILATVCLPDRFFILGICKAKK